MASLYPNMRAKEIPQIPSSVTSESLLPYVKDINNLPIGIDNNEFAIYYHNITKNRINSITGNTALSSLSFICGIIDEINYLPGNHVEVYDSTYLVNLDSNEGNIYNSVMCKF